MRKIITLITLFLTISSFSQEKNSDEIIQFFKTEIKVDKQQESKLTEIVANYLKYTTTVQQLKSDNEAAKKMRLEHLKNSFNEKVKAILNDQQYQKYTLLKSEKNTN